MLKGKRRLGAVAAGIVLGLSGCGALDGDENDAPETQDQAADSAEGPGAAEQGPQDPAAGGDAPGQEGMEGPNLEGIPEVVAEVNGTEISRDEFETAFTGQYQQMQMQAQMTGQPVDDAQLRSATVDGLVGTELLSQEAANRGIEATDEDVDAALEEFAATNQVSTEEFIATLGQEGLSEEDVMDEVRNQTEIEDLLADEFGEAEVSDQDIEAAYEEAAAQQGMMGGQPGMEQELPPLEEVRGELESQLEDQQLMEHTQTLVDQLREDADVTVHLE